MALSDKTRFGALGSTTNNGASPTEFEVIRLRHLWHPQGKTAVVRELFAPVYEWFTEGFDTVDLKEAESLPDELS